MQITLNQSEIEKAIINYVGSQGIAISGKKVSVSMIAGRGANGMSASIDIPDNDGKTIVHVSTDDDSCDDKETEEEDDKQIPLFGS